MKISAVVPLLKEDKDIVAFVDKLKSKLSQHSSEFEIILSTNLSFEFVEKLRQRIDDSFIVAVKDTNDIQQVVMAGVDKVSGDCAIIITPSYDLNIIDFLIEDWKNGKKIVCLRRKHSKFGTFFTKLRLKIYNIFLFLFGDIFSIGILKDAQLLDKELVDKMKEEQDMAHRFRTMYAPLDFNSSVHDIPHPVGKFESKGLPSLDFWLGTIGAVVTMLAFISCIILAISLEAPIWAWMLFFMFWLIFEFIFLSLLVNATARVKIGILHNVDANGCIYNLVQEYSPLEKRIKKVAKTQTKKKTSSDENVGKVEKKKTTTSKSSKSSEKTNKSTLISKESIKAKEVNVQEKLTIKKATSKQSATKSVDNKQKDAAKNEDESKPKTATKSKTKKESAEEKTTSSSVKTKTVKLK